MKVKIKKLSEDAVIPTYAHDGDAGMDLTATSKSVNSMYIEYGTSLAMEIPTGYVGLLFPRSSVSKTSLTLANSVGVIDSTYKGEIKLRFKYDALLVKIPESTYKIGERIGQIMIIPFPKVEFEEVKELSQSERGEGGFGSTNLVN